MYKSKLLDFALEDLGQITEYITKQLNNPNYARKIYKEIREKINNLSSSPEMYEPYEFVSDNPQYPSPKEYVYRKLVVGKYVILYVVDHDLKQVLAVRVFDGRSNYKSKIK